MLEYISVAAFGLGLVGGVVAMLRGVERERKSADRRPVRVTLPSASAFAAGFGATGYLLSRSGLSPLVQSSVAVLAGVAAMSLALRVISSTARRGVDPHLAAEMFQGQPAVVRRNIGDGDGEIDYVRDGRTVTVAARSITPGAIPAGAEVVIDRIEDGVAYVEEWAVVEKRI